MDKPKVWHEKEVDKVGNSYVGTIYEVRPHISHSLSKSIIY